MARTATLPGVDHKNPELTELAEKYVGLRDQRMAVLKKEVEKKNDLITMMQALKLDEYHDEEANLTITLKNEVKIKVKIGSEEGDGDPE
jgi:hypothetical protein